MAEGAEADAKSKAPVAEGAEADAKSKAAGGRELPSPTPPSEAAADAKRRRREGR